MDLTTLLSLRACRTLKTVVKCKFLSWPSDPVVTSCASDAQNCGKMQIFELAEPPFRHFMRVGRSKLWQNANFSRRRATLSSLRACRTIKTVVFIANSLCFCGGVVVFLWLCFVFLWWCGGISVVLQLCFCGGVVAFLWWCGCVFVVAWLCFCDGVFVFLWCF